MIELARPDYQSLVAELATQRAALSEELNTIDRLIRLIRTDSRSALTSHMKVSAAMISQVVCVAFEISKEEIDSRRRQRRLVIPRHIAMWLCSKLTPMSLPQIGRAFGGRDHTTVIHAIRKTMEMDGAPGEMRDGLLQALTELFETQDRGDAADDFQLSYDQQAAITFLNRIRSMQEASHE